MKSKILTWLALGIVFVLAAFAFAGLIVSAGAQGSETDAQSKGSIESAYAHEQDRRLTNCQYLDGYKGASPSLSCDETRTYRGRDIHCVSSDTRGGMVAVCDFPRFYAENPDLVATDVAAGKARAAQPVK